MWNKVEQSGIDWNLFILLQLIFLQNYKNDRIHRNI